MWWIEPYQSHGGHHEFGGDVEDLTAKTWEEAQTMHTVAPRGHVRQRTALEVAVTQPWNFCQKGETQSGFKVPPEAP
jgi:hypothetical protein